jgi:hypothetical protein
VKKLIREFGAQVVEIRPLAAAPDPVLEEDPVLKENEIDTSEESS